MYPQFERFRPALLKANSSLPMMENALLLAREGGLEVHYAPFEWVNLDAKIVIVGITPGPEQWTPAVQVAREALSKGQSDEQVLREVKRKASFAKYHERVAAMLDHIGLAPKLGIASCRTLWNEDSRLLHATSLLKNPVFHRGKPFNGQVDAAASRLLTEQIDEGFARQCGSLRGAVFVALGLGGGPRRSRQSATSGYVERELGRLLTAGRIQGTLLGSLPHPSGANNGRVKYFLGETTRSDIHPRSSTDPKVLDAALKRLREQVSAMAPIAAR